MAIRTNTTAKGISSEKRKLINLRLAIRRTAMERTWCLCRKNKRSP